MSNKRKTGWATITHKDGSSITGEIKTWRGDECLVTVCGCRLWINIPVDSTITYIDPPMPVLPTKLGSVIEAWDGMRFMLTNLPRHPWISYSALTGFRRAHEPNDVSAYCREHGGFTILVEGK